MTVTVRDAVINFEMSLQNRRLVAADLQHKALLLLVEDVTDVDGPLEGFRVRVEVDGIEAAWGINDRSSTSLLFLTHTIDAPDEEDFSESETILIIQEYARVPQYRSLQRVARHSVFEHEPDIAVQALLKECVDSLQV